MNVEINNIEEVLMKSLEDACGLTAYKKILEKNKITTTEYQKNFTNYYKVRRDSAWLEKFYGYLNNNKDNTSITFEEILRKLSSWEHKIKKSEKNPNGVGKTTEASFASKLLATINPNYPIWDSQVVRALKINLVDADKIGAYVKAYEELTEGIKKFIDSDEGKKAIELFDKQFPNYTWVSNYKKIDFYLWNIGKN